MRKFEIFCKVLFTCIPYHDVGPGCLISTAMLLRIIFISPGFDRDYFSETFLCLLHCKFDLGFVFCALCLGLFLLGAF